MSTQSRQSSNQSPAKSHLSAMATGLSHGKIILMGEHSVVYSYPAIAMPFAAAEITAQVTPGQYDTVSIDCPYITGPMPDWPDHLDNLKAAILLSFETMKRPVEPLHLVINSTIPVERGMGSSAAVAVAIIRALYAYYQEDLDDQALYFIANQAEVIAHGSTSGIDTLMCSNDQPIIYAKGKKTHWFHLNLDAYLIVADTGLKGQTKLAVEGVAQLKAKAPDRVQKIMENIGQIVRQAKLAIDRKDAVQLGRLMTYNQYHLNLLGVSNETIDRLVNAAWLAGALGAKLTGGGLGGCVIALADTPQIANQVAQAMEVAGADQTWIQHLLDL